MGYNALNDEIRDNVTRMRRALAFDLLALNGDDLRKNHFQDARPHFAKFSSAPSAAFSTSNTLKATAWKCLRPFASLALRALSQRSSMRRISPGHRLSRIEPSAFLAL